MTESPEGHQYLQVRCAAMSLRFSRDRLTDRTPVLQSVIRWPTREGPIAISQTIDQSRFTLGADGGDGGFLVFDVADKALCGELPLNFGDVEVDVAVLAVPGSSLLDRATAFLSEVAALTLVPQLTAAAPLATKIANGVDSLLGNDEVEGILALSTSVPADAPRAGYYVVTDLTANSTHSLDDLSVIDDRLQRYSRERKRWEPATGFSYLLLEVVIDGSKPNRWADLPEIVDLSVAALTSLSTARTEQDVRDAWPQMHLAVLKALYSQNLAHRDRDLAAKSLTDQWKQEVLRRQAITEPPSGGMPSAAAGTDAAISGDSTQSATPPADTAPALEERASATALRIGEELDAMVKRIEVEEVTVTARDIAGSVKALNARGSAWVKAGKLSVEADNVSAGGNVTAIDLG